MHRKDLWKVCNDYGTVVNVFIPNKKSKVGKRFAFVRFIKAKGQFQTGSYVNVVNGSFPVGVHGPSIFSASVLALDDSCVAERDLSNHIMGKVKDVSSISNLRTLIMEEGFSVVNLVYLGGKVYMVQAKELFTRSPIFLGQKEMEYTSDEDSDVGPQKVPDRSQFCEGGPNDDRVSHVEEVSETNFRDNSSIPMNHIDESEKQQSEDPFNIYRLLRKQPGDDSHEVSSSLSHPPGFTPDVSVTQNENGQSAKGISVVVNAKVMNNSQDVYKEASCDNVDSNVVKREGPEAVGNSGGILCVWEATVFKKDYATILDNFVAIYGTWLPSNFKVLLVAIYAPQQSFDRFISTSGLVDVKMEGYTFTWSHPSRSKMSKLDWVLVSEGIFLIFPSITAVCLDRHLSDHRPIILYEVQADFGPIPFRFYHSWISLEGFDAMLEQTWRIRAWIMDKRSSVSREKDSIKKELSDIDRLLAGGDVFDSNLLRRSELHRNLYNINHMESKEYLQKSKIKWVIEGDENSNFFYGLINKKRSQLVIRGVFVDGIWKYWNLVGSDLCDAAEHFLETGSFPNVCNSSFVALIPKITDAKFVNYFRPISLIGSVYKVVTKILDGSFILNELLHWCKRKKKQVMFFKVDFAKAYDSVRWDYLLDVLEAFGFVNIWCLKGVHLHGSTSISHFFYAEDVMFIEEWSDDNLKGIINILQCFFLASGLKINIQKSQVLGVGVPSSIVMQAASSIGCGVLHKQFCYLGVMVGECMFRHNAWASTTDKLRSRFPNGRVGSEYQHLTDLNLLMESVSLSHSCERWICDLSGEGEFRVKEVRNFLDNLFLPSYADATRWVKYIPIKINVFVWRARRDFLPTRVNLSRRGILLESSSCPLCLSSEENINHVLFGCGLVENIFRRICRWWELDWQALESFSDWNYWFPLIGLSSKVKASLEGVFCVVWWSIWGFRNRTIYSEMPPRRSVLFDDVVSLSFNWFSSRCNRAITWDS
nr:RNA-directed DNA polymerase, eukaryota [Tanacetum cinerariifolium]